MKNNLESARWDWDKEEMWADIETNLPPVEEPKKPFLIWLVFGFVALGIISTFTYLWISNKATENTKAVVEVSTLEFSKTNNDYNQKYNEKVITQNTIFPIDDHLNNTNPKKDIDTNVSDDIKSKEIKEQAAIVQENVKSVEGDSDLNMVPTQAINIEVENTSNSFEIENQLILNDNSEHLVGPLDSESNTQNVQYNQKEKSVLEEIIDKHNAAFSQSSELSLSKLYTGIHFLTINEERSFILPSTKSENDFIQPLETKWLSSLAFYANYSLLHRTLTNTVSESLLFDRRTTDEKVLEGFGAQINYRLHFNKNFFAEVGVEYQRLNEVVNFEERVVSQEIVPSDSASYFVNFAGEIQYVDGEKIQTRIKKTGYNSYNEHHFVNAPIHIGYSQKVRGLSISVVVGPVLNIYQSYRGDVIGNDLSFIEDAQVDDFKNSLFTAFDTGIYLDYNLGKNLSLSSGINYRKSLSKFTIDNVINQAYNTVDFKLGLLFKI